MALIESGWVWIRLVAAEVVVQMRSGSRLKRGGVGEDVFEALEIRLDSIDC